MNPRCEYRWPIVGVHEPSAWPTHRCVSDAEPPHTVHRCACQAEQHELPPLRGLAAVVLVAAVFAGVMWMLPSCASIATPRPSPPPSPVVIAQRQVEWHVTVPVDTWLAALPAVRACAVQPHVDHIDGHHDRRITCRGGARDCGCVLQAIEAQSERMAGPEWTIDDTSP